jgi:hypothetical protein
MHVRNWPSWSRRTLSSRYFARKTVPTILRAPDTTELTLANQNNAGIGQIATITSVDFSMGPIKSSKHCEVRDGAMAAFAKSSRRA